jgi:hypothetical protein
MMQNLYIDLYTNGLEAAINQIVNVAQGNNSFTPQVGFSNLTYMVQGDLKKLTITINASHYLEPIPNFLILTKNTESELNFSLPKDGPYRGGFNKDIQLNDGRLFNAQVIAAFRGITPEMPLIIEISATTDNPIVFSGLMHQKTHDNYQSVPEKIHNK